MQGTIRRADPADVPSLEIVRRQALENGLSGEYDRSAFADVVARPDADLEGWIEAPDAAFLALVVETDVTITAYGVYDREDAVIRGLYTAPDYERHGCASALLARFEDAAREDGAAAIEATVPRNAVPFFEAQGFERRDEREWRGLVCPHLMKPIDATEHGSGS